MPRPRQPLLLGCEQLARLINHRHGADGALPGAPTRILVCTDDPTAARCQTELLHRGGFWPDVAATTEHAIVRLATGLYAAVTIDAALMDGAGAGIVQAMARSAALRHTPVVVVATISDGTQGFSVGAVCLADWVVGQGAITRLIDTLCAPPRAL